MKLQAYLKKHKLSARGFALKTMKPPCAASTILRLLRGDRPVSFELSERISASTGNKVTVGEITQEFQQNHRRRNGKDVQREA